MSSEQPPAAEEPASTPLPARPHDREDGADRVRPDHLVVWLQGLGAEGADPVVLDDEVGPDFRLAQWVAELHDGYRDATVAAVYRGLAAPTAGDGGAAAADLHRRLDDVIGCLRGGATGFTGDTTPTSLARLRTWTRATAGGGGSQPPPASDDVVLLVDELASNVERHAPGWLTVDLLVRPDRTTVVVTDPRPWALPTPGDRTDPADVGRGMVIVAGLSCDWGVVVGPTTKSVFATLQPRR